MIHFLYLSEILYSYNVGPEYRKIFQKNYRTTAEPAAMLLHIEYSNGNDMLKAGQYVDTRFV